MKRGLCVLLACLLLMTGLPVWADGTLETRITGLETNGLVNPMGIDASEIAFDWRMESDRIGARQTAYQIIVKDEAGTVTWDSGEVQSSCSVGIIYEGEPLSAQSIYTWVVTVTDETGTRSVSEPACFETGLRSASLDAWNGATWIGADAYPLDAASAAVFDLSMTMQLTEESPRAGMILGAGDFRLANRAYNIWGSETENSYFNIEIDASEPANPLLKLYAVGMPAALQKPTDDAKVQAVENDPSEPDFIFELAEVLPPDAVFQPLTLRVETAEEGTSNLHIQINGADALGKNKIVTLNPLGGDISYNSYPNLNGIGFAVPEGSSVVFTDVQVKNPGQFSDDVLLFGKDTGATYAIFEGLDGVSVDGGNITVSGGTIAWADPSWGSMPLLQGGFTLQDQEVTRARLYVSAEGLYELSLNGQSVSDTWFNPGDEEYRVRMPYQTYDVTELLTSGDNVLRAQLAEGWWTGQTSYYAYNYNFYGSREALLAKLDVTYADGSTQTVVTDPSTWKVSVDGPVRYASLYHGERYDARRTLDALTWQDAVEIPQTWNFSLVTREDTPAHVVRTRTAVELVGESKEGSGTYIYDMGENVIGVPSIEIPNTSVDPGETVTVRYAEILYPELEEYCNAGIDGMMMVENLRAALVTDFYTSGENGILVEPHFTFHGYRYVEIGGLKEALPVENVQMLVLSSIENTATYESSNALVNQLFANVQNSQTSNFLSIPTDCPQRNERLGWTGDAQVFSTAASYNADVYNFYRNWMRTFAAEQGEDGALPTYAPCYGAFGNSSSGSLTGISWEGTIALVPYYLYRQTGRTEMIRDNFDAMLRYMDFLAATPMKNSKYLTGKTGPLADWLSLEMTNNALVNNAVYIYLMDIIREMAEVIGEEEVAAAYAERYELTKAEWNATYVTPETGLIGKPGKDTQTGYATPLRFGVISEENIATSVGHLLDTVARANYTLTTGFSGTPNLLPVLTGYGYAEEAYKLFEQTDYASWLYPVTQGATSVWERWNSYTVEGGFNGNNSMNSFNHFSLGAVTEWMMACQLGIAPGTEAGYHSFILQPTVGGSFTGAKGSFESDYGTIESGWTAEDGVITGYHAVVPANTGATLYLPISEAQAQAVALPEGISYQGMELHNGRECAVFALQSGSYDIALG